jgi:hypothetical protein
LPYRLRTNARSNTAADGHDAQAMVVLPASDSGTTMMFHWPVQQSELVIMWHSRDFRRRPRQ